MDEDLETWCQQHIELPDAEIEYVSLAAAYAVLLADLGITLKIHHLDLSPGAEANIHTLAPDSKSPAAGDALPTIWMLYRP
jgi:Peptidase C65 Otubain